MKSPTGRAAATLTGVVYQETKTGYGRRRDARSPLSTRSSKRSTPTVEEPRKPDRPPAVQAHQYRATQPALYRVPTCSTSSCTQIYRLPASATAIALPEGWLSWARRCRLKPFVKLPARWGWDPRRDPLRPLQRPGGGDQHTDPPDRSPHLRVSLPQRR